MTRQLIPTLILSALCVSAVPSLAIAQDDAKKEARYNELLNKAKKLYSEKKFDQSLKMFEAAYAVKKNPKLLFNMGIISERLGRLEDAVKYYDKFVVSPELSLSLRGKGQKRLDVLRPIVEAQKKKEADAKKALEAKNNKNNNTNNQNNNNTNNQNNNNNNTKNKDSGSNSKVFGYVLTGVGAASMLGGGVLLLTLGDEMAFTEELTAADRRAARGTRNNRKTTGTILVGAGGAILTTGLIIWALSGDEKEDVKETSWTITPGVGIGSANVSIFKRF